MTTVPKDTGSNLHWELGCFILSFPTFLHLWSVLNQVPRRGAPPTPCSKFLHKNFASAVIRTRDGESSKNGLGPSRLNALSIGLKNTSPHFYPINGKFPLHVTAVTESTKYAKIFGIRESAQKFEHNEKNALPYFSNKFFNGGSHLPHVSHEIIISFSTDT